jgi:hypothetical protein
VEFAFAEKFDFSELVNPFRTFCTEDEFSWAKFSETLGPVPCGGWVGLGVGEGVGDGVCVGIGDRVGVWVEVDAGVNVGGGGEVVCGGKEDCIGEGDNEVISAGTEEVGC